MTGNTSPMVTRARLNRADMTGAEERLWSVLRARRIRYKFRRQRPIGRYVVDFACSAIKLAIEVDGPNHDTQEQKAFDAEREDYLRMAGWRVTRFANADIYQALGDVEARIWSVLEPE